MRLRVRPECSRLPSIQFLPPHLPPTPSIRFPGSMLSSRAVDPPPSTHPGFPSAVSSPSGSPYSAKTPATHPGSCLLARPERGFPGLYRRQDCCPPTPNLLITAASKSSSISFLRPAHPSQQGGGASFSFYLHFNALPHFSKEWKAPTPRTRDCSWWDIGWGPLPIQPAGLTVVSIWPLHKNHH